MGLIPGLRELALIALVLITLYGRSGFVRTIVREATARPGGRRAAVKPARGRWLSNRLYLFLTILAATAVVTIIVTRAWVIARPAVAS